jgi:ATP-dependent Clp protease ATP-binding subunit ClpA
LFIGSAGVGKTLCAKALAAEVFNGENSFIRLDMSEYSEPHSISKIIGSPPGYSGYNECVTLAEQLRKSPYSLVLFDDMEKAHPDVKGLVLQILEEGMLTDSSGRQVSFSNCIIIITATVNNITGIGFGAESDKALPIAAAKQIIPELAERVDEIIPFNKLQPSQLAQIANMQLNGFKADMAKKGITVEFDKDFAANVMSLAKPQSPRTVARTALRLAEEAVAELLITENAKNLTSAEIFIENGRGIAKIKQNSY